MGISAMLQQLADEVDAVLERDPAARSRTEVMLTYASFHAMLCYRLAHRLWRAEWYLLARIISQLGRFLTGIEIHPGARIGKRFFVDHGSGVVIGETAIIGDNVTLYQDVSLGGVAPAVDSASQRGVKRHPTIGDGVIIGAGAQVIGDIIVNEGARVGANAVVLNDVPPGVVVVGIPAKIVAPKNSCRDFTPYGIPSAGISDPVMRLVDQLSEQVELLQNRVRQLEEASLSNKPAMSGENFNGFDQNRISS